jgi:hypothetical protein
MKHSKDLLHSESQSFKLYITSSRRRRIAKCLSPRVQAISSATRTMLSASSSMPSDNAGDGATRGCGQVWGAMSVVAPPLATRR